MVQASRSNIKSLLCFINNCFFSIRKQKFSSFNEFHCIIISFLCLCCLSLIVQHSCFEDFSFFSHFMHLNIVLFVLIIQFFRFVYQFLISYLRFLPFHFHQFYRSLCFNQFGFCSPQINDTFRFIGINTSRECSCRTRH